jgi:hypothetical protein
VGLQALRTPPAKGWGARVYLATGGKRVVGTGLALDFARYDAVSGPPAVALHLGSQVVYPIYATEIRVDAPEKPLALIARSTASAEALRDQGAAILAELRRDSLAALTGNRVRACDRGPYRGDGVEPECTLRPLTPDERRDAQQKLQRYFTATEQLLARAHGAMYEALVAALPAGCAWP